MRSAWEEYSETRMLGAYHPEDAVLRQEEHGVSTVFDDTYHSEQDGHVILERRMLIDGKGFHITSVFPGHPTATPTDKMLELIDAELKKDTYVG